MSFFNRVTIRTPESVELEFTLAGIGNRVLALLLDYTVLSLLITGLLLLSTLLSEQLVDLAVFWGGTETIELWLAALTLLTTFALYIGYFVVFETLWQGQTPGKRFAKIRVIRDNGQPEGLFQASLRSLLRPIDDTLFLGFFLIVFGQAEKRLGDWVAGTLVVQAERPLKVQQTLQISPAAETIADQLLQLAQPDQLLPDELAVIRTYLQRRKTLSQGARSQLSLKLARQIKPLIGLEHLPGDMTPDVFLEAVYVAYQKRAASN